MSAQTIKLLSNLNTALNLAVRIKAESNPNETLALFRSGLLTLALLPCRERNEVCKAVAKKTGAAWEDYSAEILRAREQQFLDSSGLPAIKVSNRQLAEIAGDVVAELSRINAGEPELFRHGGGLVSIRVDEKGRAVIHRHDVISLRGLAARRMRFVSYRANGEPVNVEPPRSVIEDVLRNSADVFPVLHGLTATPVMHADGSVCAVRGFDPETSLYFAAEPGFKLALVQDQPAKADALAAREYIDRTLFKDFPFATASDKANAHAALVTVFLRSVEGFTSIRLPLFCVDAPKGGHGKTLLASAITVSATGQMPDMNGLAESESEIRKSITAILAEGRPVVLLDNAAGALRSPSIARLLTASSWSDRLLSESRNFTGANNAVWFVTGTNLEFSYEIARRVVRIRLDAKMAHPEDRADIAEERLGMDKFGAWIMAHRGEICGAVLTMIRAWIAGGRPRVSGRVMGSFEVWSQITRDILAFAGVTDFLGNTEQVRAESDEETAQWLPVLTWAVVVFGGGDNQTSTFRTAELADLLKKNDLVPKDILPDIGRDRADSERDSTDAWDRYKKRFGHAVKRKVGTRYGPFELRFERALDKTGKPVGCSHTGQAYYVVAGDLDGLRNHLKAEKRRMTGEEEPGVGEAGVGEG